MSFQKILFFLFMLISLSHLKTPNLNIPPKESFIPIESGVNTLIELTSADSELYYSFDNHFEYSDIAITVKNAHQYTTIMYFYENYESIEKNENGDYINYTEDIDLSEKFSYINNTKECTYYIIIKDLGGFYTKDYINIYNSKDILELKQEEPFTIKMFFENNLYTFHFTGEENDLIELNLNINDINFEQNVDIYKNDIKFYSKEINEGKINLNEDKKSGDYKIMISSLNNETYKEIKSSIILTKNKNKVNIIEPEKELNIFYINSMNIYLYLNIDNYNQNEEGIITFKISHNAYKHNYIEYCYSKNMNFENFNDEDFINNMPSNKDDSNSYFNRLNYLETIYHLYFSKDKLDEEGKKNYLLIHCKLNIDKYTEPEKITILPSTKPNTLDISNKDKINEKISLQSYIPKIYKIKIPIEENLKSYVFYTKNKLQTIYEDSMLNKDYSNEEQVQIYAISKEELKKEKDNYKIIYIKFFGGNDEINLRIESTNSEIYSYTSIYRTSKTFTKEILNPNKSFYFIGDYSLMPKDYNFYLEEIYGKFDIYYKNEVLENESILTNENNNYLVNSKIGNLTDVIDILEIKCKEPGYFNLYVFSQYSSNTIFDMYERKLAIIQKGEILISPKINKEQTQSNLEINTILGNEIEIVDAHKIINSENKFYQENYNDTIPEQIKLNIKEDNTLISFILTDNDLYQIVESSPAVINKENILVKLPNNIKYENATISLKGKFNSYIYSLFKRDSHYGFNLNLSRYELISSEGKDNNNITISNPYTKSNIIISDKPESPFYLALYITNPENVEISIVYNNDNSGNDDKKEDSNDDITVLIIICIIIPFIIIFAIISFYLVKKKSQSTIDDDLPEENTGLIGNM